MPAGYEKILEILEQESPPSVLLEDSGYEALILRHLDFKEGKLFLSSECFIFKENEVFAFDVVTRKFDRLGKGYEVLVSKVSNLYLSNQKILAAYSDEIEKLEDSLFERRIPGYFMEVWLRFKKDIAKLENFYFRNEIVYNEFFNKHISKFGKHGKRFEEVKNTISFHSSSLDSLKSRMDSLHHYYDSTKNEKLNRTIFSLTVLSGVFLPLNLIVGFFGMNTEGLFFKDDPNGTKNVILVLLGIVVFVLLGVRLIKLLDFFVFRFLLGRYDVYKNMINRLEDFDSRLKGK